MKLIRKNAQKGLPTCKDADLLWLLSAIQYELRKRRREAARKAGIERWAGACNFMAGVTWALACRQSLRQSKGLPGIGRGRASGEMWYPYEWLTAARQEAKERGWSPLSQKHASDVLARLYVELNRKEPQESARATFHIRMASQTSVLHIDDNVLTGRS